MIENKPWFKFYGDVPHSIDVPNIILYDKLVLTAKEFPNNIAWDFMGTTYTYAQFLKDIDLFANALAAIGFKKGDTITISMPTAPNGIIPIYAVNKLGGICSMIHPLSPSPQIKMFLNMSKSKFAITLDAFYKPFKEILHETGVEKLILCKIGDYLKPVMKFGFWLTKGRKIPKIPEDPRVVWYSNMLTSNSPMVSKSDMKSDDLAIILYSGGTTGVPKGIMLSNKNMIAEGMMCAKWGNISTGDKILAILPIFHGFGLGVCVNAAFMEGGQSILIPTFTPETVASLVKKKRPQYLIGVPTLFEALANSKKFQNTDLSCLKVCFSGADTLPRQVKENFERVAKQAGGNVVLLEGYGLTEAVTAIMASPIQEYRENSIGVPFPNMDAKICKLNTIEEQTLGEEGEVVLNGPAVMLGYLDHPEETAKVLKKHADGKIWLHTGDIATQDEDGFFYFKLRLKRMLKVSGINVYPKNVEEILRKHPQVDSACVIGLPDKKQISRVKAFIVLKENREGTDEDKSSIQKYCQENLLKYECPREIEFRKDLPTTLVGKIAFKKLEDEEIKKLKDTNAYPYDS
ncbi:AMP-binding protein [Candidatus Lokiarchaeum ossiferum]|uniref:AMP-binding protein n=1 Tax=Candidatus Lokiarchaeum ossiferum TaxID=2951803 RepID=UPI00352DD15F